MPSELQNLWTKEQIFCHNSVLQEAKKGSVLKCCTKTRWIWLAEEWDIFAWLQFAWCTSPRNTFSSSQEVLLSPEKLLMSRNIGSYVVFTFALNKTAQAEGSTNAKDVGTNWRSLCGLFVKHEASYVTFPLPISNRNDCQSPHKLPTLIVKGF